MAANALDWNRIFFNDLPLEFLGEVVLRSVIMFVVILATIRASGKRGIKQLSVFELVLIIGLGSAAGDPMFYEDVGIVPAMTVFFVVILLYIGVTSLADRFVWVEQILEGKPVYIMKEGRVILDAFKSSGMSKDEFFGALRINNVEHLGQVKTVLIETSGDFSILFFTDGEVKAGLPIFPHLLDNKTDQLLSDGAYACCDCGSVGNLSKGKHACTACGCGEWIEPIDSKRIS